MIKRCFVILIISMFTIGIVGCNNHTKDNTNKVNFESETNSDISKSDNKQISNSILDRSKLAKDKVAISEIHHAILMLIADDTYLSLTSSNKEVAANEDGEISIKDLLDTSTEVGQNAVKEISNMIELKDDMLKLHSDFNNECFVQIVKLDPSNKKIVIQLVSKSYDIQFYVDEKGEHDGIYKN